MIVSFIDYEPPRRFDGLPWTQARIEEAAASAGPWTPIDTKALDPLDTDPSNPAQRSFTTGLATVTNGWYRIVFLDAASNEAPATTPVQYLAGLEDDVRPTVPELSNLMRARTKGEFSNQGVFNAQTVPTADQADELIDLATDHVLIKLGTDFAAKHYRHVRTAILFKTAALVEMTYYPEQANSDNSAYALYQAQYDELMGTLVNALKNQSASSLTPAWAMVPITGYSGYVE